MLRCRPLEDESNKKKHRICKCKPPSKIRRACPQIFISSRRLLHRVLRCNTLLMGFDFFADSLCVYCFFCCFCLVFSHRMHISEHDNLHIFSCFVWFYLCIWISPCKRNALAGAIQYSIRVTESWSQQNQPFCLTCKKTSWVTTLKSNYIGFRTE